MPRLLTLLLVTLSLVLSTTASKAAPKSVQVVAILSEDAFQNAQALTDALRRAVETREGFVLAKGEYSLEVMTAALACPDPPDQACLRKIAKKIGADHYIWGTLRKAAKNHVAATLSFWEKGSNQRTTTVEYSANLTDSADETLAKIAAESVVTLLGPPEGSLVIRAGKLDGAVFVNDTERGKLVRGRAELKVPAGEVHVRLVIPGYRDSLTTARVPPGDAAEVTLEPVLTSQPGQTDQQHAAQGGDSSHGTSHTVAYAVLGIGAAVALAGGVSWYLSYNQQQDQAYQDYRAQVPVGEDACDKAREDHRQNIVDLCNNNSVTRVLALVLTPIGLGISGLAGVLLATGRTGNRAATAPPPPRVVPRVGFGAGSGRLDLQVRF